MTIQIELDPSTESVLIRKARENGMEPGGYATRIVMDAIATAEKQSPRQAQEQFIAALDEMASRSVPPLPFDDQNWSRSIIYGEHD